MKRVSWIAFALAAGHLIVAIEMTISPNPEGAAGGIGYAGMYAVPALLIGLGLRARRPAWWRVTGWASAVLCALYIGLVLINWPGYSQAQATVVVAVTLPTVVVDLAAAWVVAYSSRYWRRPVSGSS